MSELNLAASEAILPITGMTCANCAATIERTLKKVGGVSEATVNYASERATVQFNPDSVRISELAAVIERIGYGVGLVDGETYLDLDYILDSNADVDMNVVMTSDGRFIEVQSTGEESTYSRAEFNALVDLAEAGLKQIHEIQAEALDGIE